MGKKNNTVKADIADKIKEAMSLRGMTRKQLADAVGRQPSEVTKWLGGNHNFTVDLLSEISDAVGAKIMGGASYCNQYAVGPIMLSGDIFRALEYKARSTGGDVASYVKDILLREISPSGAKAASFCGIWKDEDFGMSVEEQIADIKAHRSVHRRVEEL